MSKKPKKSADSDKMVARHNVAVQQKLQDWIIKGAQGMGINEVQFIRIELHKNMMKAENNA